MKKAVSHAWQRLAAWICVLAMTAAYLPAIPVNAESKNGYSTFISADQSEADVGEKITFDASVSFNAAESSDEEAEEFSYAWYVNGDRKGDGDSYTLNVDSLDDDAKDTMSISKLQGKRAAIP